MGKRKLGLKVRRSDSFMLSAHPDPSSVRKHDTLWTIIGAFDGQRRHRQEVAECNSIQPTQLRSVMALNVSQDFRQP